MLLQVDDYLTLDEDESEGLADLRSHKLVFSNAQVKDHMARTDNTDDYVVRRIRQLALRGLSSYASAAEFPLDATGLRSPGREAEGEVQQDAAAKQEADDRVGWEISNMTRGSSHVPSREGTNSSANVGDEDAAAVLSCPKGHLSLPCWREGGNLGSRMMLAGCSSNFF